MFLVDLGRDLVSLSVGGSRPLTRTLTVGADQLMFTEAGGGADP